MDTLLFAEKNKETPMPPGQNRKGKIYSFKFASLGKRDVIFRENRM